MPRHEQEHILGALKQLEDNPEEARPEPLAGRTAWKLRVGGRRILFIPDRERKLFIVTTVRPRGDVYKGSRP